MAVKVRALPEPDVGVAVGVCVEEEPGVRVTVGVNVDVAVGVAVDVPVGTVVGMGPTARKLNASTSLADKPQVLPSKYRLDE